MKADQPNLSVVLSRYHIGARLLLRTLESEVVYGGPGFIQMGNSLVFVVYKCLK